MDVDFIATHHLRYGIGVGIVGSIITVVNILTFAKVWEETFKFYGIPPIAVFTIFPAGYIFVCWFTGYLFDIKGIWKAETKFANRNQNPEILEIYENIKLIKKHLNIKDEDKEKRLP